MGRTKKETTIRAHIDNELARIENESQLHDICYALDQDIRILINDVDNHLKKINGQMPDYDMHDKSHSEQVLQLIEKLLGSSAIQQMPFLEAELLLLCCHFHDTGMAMPDWCLSLLNKVEVPDFSWHKSRSEVMTALHKLDSGWAPSKAHSEIKELFMVPKTEPNFLEWLADEIWLYERYRQGLKPWDDKKPREQWVLETREDFLRNTHGIRSKNYAKNIGKTFKALNKYSSIQNKLAQDVGSICSTHTQPVDTVWKLPSFANINPGFSDDSLSYNPQFLAMLLRLGDVLDFSEVRASRTLYAEHNPMNETSDKHWQAKNLTGLSVEIKSGRNKMKQIRFMGSFSNPEHYYFIHDYFQCADDELKNYDLFLQTMERDKAQLARYDLHLPREVDRTNVEADNFVPDKDIRFTLEQRQIIDLLMGSRLYSDEFTCLRELYQNALDASRCMQAENQSHGRIQELLPIFFGMERDEETGRIFLFCRDQGIGMSKETVKNYLLRVGKSYYRSAQFRQDNAIWGNAVIPASEFGIGLLSCFMIGDRIEVLTRHFEANQEALWVCIESAENYGYFREPSPSMQDRIGPHGTEVRVFLKEDALKMLDDSLPASQEEAMDYFAMTGRIEQFSSVAVRSFFNTTQIPLWCRLQSIICVPESGFPVIVSGDGQSYTLENMQRRYPIENRYAHINPFLQKDNIGDKIRRYSTLGMPISVSYTDPDTGTEALCHMYFPTSSETDIDISELNYLLSPIGARFCVDGLSIERLHIFSSSPFEMCWNFKGTAKPALSVSREWIRSESPAFIAAKKRVLIGIYHEINKAIMHYFKQYPAQGTNNCKSFLLRCLWMSFERIERHISNCPVLPYLWRELSEGAFYGHIERGVPMEALQEKACNFSFKPSELELYTNEYDDHLSDIIPAVLLRAKNICLNSGSISVEINEGPTIQEEKIFSDMLVYKTQSGTASWGQWDIITNLLPFVSPSMFQAFKGSALGTGWVKSAKVPPYNVSKAILSTISLWGGDLSITLPQLQASGLAIINRYDPISVDVSNGVPLLMVRIPPEKITDEAEQVIQTYRSIPSYEKGIREGWTMLLFSSRKEPNYCYILAPGNIDRYEMAKHIPKDTIAEAAASGHPLRFTDGTLAFPES